MEFGFTDEQERLRKEVHDFYINELPEDYDQRAGSEGGSGQELEAFWREFQNKAVQKGYPTAGWPKKYGGLGMTGIEQGITTEEQSYWGVMWPGFQGYNLVGPVVLTIGTEEQKQRFVPPIIRGDEMWYQAFTEPEAGSDEANVQLRAVPDGDDFVFNGQKTFITCVYKPDWLFTLARTADTVPKHRGISLVAVPADSPGITYRPLPTLGGSSQVEIFFDNVRVPKKYLLGELNRGFYHAMATFEFERAGIGGGASEVRRGMDRLVDFCRKEKRNGKPLIKDPQVRRTLALAAVQMEVSWLTKWHNIWWSGARDKIGPQSYFLGVVYVKEWAAPSAKAMMDAFGLYGQLKGGSKYVKMGGTVQRRWESSRSYHAGGTLEIQKMVLATRGLGLPRIPRQFNVQISDALKKVTGG